MTSSETELTNDFYVVGGTMRSDAPSYVEREADKYLLEALSAGEFCYVLTARQMGKSSLIVRTVKRLEDRGVSAVLVDLTAIGRNVTAWQWYGGLLVQIVKSLGLEWDLMEFWSRESIVGPLQKWMEAMRTIVLRCHLRRLVVFIDEIDAVRSLPFPADEFFAGLRECYNRRDEDPEMRRLTFCLSGVATPSALIADTRMTPFNIGRRIELRDFAEDVGGERLIGGLPKGHKAGKAILKRIFYWTGGHPYLTQRLCKAAASDNDVRGRRGVDRLCDKLFFSSRARERDDNLLFVRDRMLDGGNDVAGLLQLYAVIRDGMAIEDDENEPGVESLRLAGIVRTNAGRLTVRNRIYAKVFDKRWIEANMPGAYKRRLRAAFKRGVRRAATVGVLILGLVGWLALVAIQKSDKRLLYVTAMRSLPREWENGNVGKVEQLMGAIDRQAGGTELRGFEWQVFERRINSASVVLPYRRIANISAGLDADSLIITEAVRPGDFKYVISLYSLSNQSRSNLFEVPAGVNFDLVATSSEKGWIACDGPDSNLSVRDLHSGDQRRNFEGLSGGLTAIAASADGRVLAAADFNGHVKLWEVEANQTKTSFNLDNWAHWIALSRDGSLLATGDESQSVKVWDAATGRPIRSFELPHAKLTQFSFFPDGKSFITSSLEGALTIWDVKTGERLKALRGHTSDVRCFAFDPTSRTLATGGVDQTVRLWDVESGEALETIGAHSSPITSLAWSHDAHYLISGAEDGKVKIWDESPAYRARRDKVFATRRLVRQICAAAFMPDGDLIAVGADEDKQVKVWNLSTGEEIRVLKGGAESEIKSGAFSKARNRLATGREDHLIDIWDVATGTKIRSLFGRPGAVTNVEFSPDGSTLLSGGLDHVLKLWDVATGEELGELPCPAGSDYRAVFSPDGTLIASSCQDGSVMLWDAAKRRVIHRLEGHKGQIRAIAFSADSQHLATAGRDNFLRLWDVSSGKLRAMANSLSTTRIAFSPKFDRLVTGAEDGSVNVWDVNTLQELMTLKGHNSLGVSSVIFSADGRDLATTGWDGTIWIWRGGKAEERPYARIDDASSERR